MKSILITTGRTLLALYFILPGIMKFVAWDMNIALMELHNMPFATFLLPIAGIIQVVAGLCLLLNKHMMISALTLAGMTLVINLNLHDFWNTYQGVDSGRELQNFVKNLGIFAGLLVLAGLHIPDTHLSSENQKASERN
ncbi:DoxX family protein [Aequoribacter sp.]|uniref:DoxX family protein n=1 Tax=Aequoribacter sp. TaxID=2847771 RepID=UPI003C4B4BED